MFKNLSKWSGPPIYDCLISVFVNKVLVGTLYLAATFLLLSPFSRSFSAWHFSQSVLWVYFRFPATNITRMNNATT